MFTLQEVESLNELEFLICEYIQKNKDTVVEMTIRELANKVHVSTTTILRLCKKFNCDGYAEFKIKLKMYIEQENEINEKNDRILFIQFLEMLEKEDYVSAIDKVSTLVNIKRNLFFLGEGISKIVAQYGASYFTSNCKLAIFIDELNSLSKLSFFNDSIVFILSVRGDSQALIDNIEKIKKAGGIVISITNTHVCRVAELSDINIPYYAELKTISGQALPSQLHTMYIIEKIAKECLEKLQI